MQRYIAIFFLIGLLIPGLAKEMDPSRGKILLSGLVIAPSDGNSTGAVQGASVELVGTELKTKTNSDGQFVFTKAPNGEVTVRISKEGYQPVMRTAKIDSSSLNPATFTVELLPVGMSKVGDSLTGRGTLYVAFSTKILDQSKGPKMQRLSDEDIRKRLAVNPDSLEVVTQMDETNPGKRPLMPITLEPNHIMIYPPMAPPRSTFFIQNSPIYKLAFDGSGRYLYTAGEGGEVRIWDESGDREPAGRVLMPGGKAIVSSLNSSDDGRYIYAAVISAQSGISVIDTARNQGVAYLPLDNLNGASPSCVVAGPAGTLLVTVSAPAQNGRLLVVDLQTGMTVHSIPVGAVPTCVSTTPDKRWGYVTNSHSGNVTVIDLETFQPLGLLPVGVSPQQCAVTPDGKRLLVTNLGSDTLSVIDTQAKKVMGMVRVGKEPSGLVVTPDSKICYVANKEAGTISTVDLETLKQIYETDPMPLASPGNLVLRP